jgi:hypothetical protein
MLDVAGYPAACAADPGATVYSRESADMSLDANFTCGPLHLLQLEAGGATKPPE